MIKEIELQRVIKCNIGKKCNSCNTGKYKGIRIANFELIMCDNCGKNLLPLNKKTINGNY